jgi:hypothetical protein
MSTFDLGAFDSGVFDAPSPPEGVVAPIKSGSLLTHTGYGSTRTVTLSTTGTDKQVFAFIYADSILSDISFEGGELTWILLGAIESAIDNKNCVKIYTARAATAITDQTLTLTKAGGPSNLGLFVQAWEGCSDYTGLVANTDFGFGSYNPHVETNPNPTVNVTTIQGDSHLMGVSGLLFWEGGYTAIANTTVLVTSNQGALVERNSAPLAIGSYAMGVVHGVTSGNWRATVGAFVEILGIGGGGGGEIIDADITETTTALDETSGILVVNETQSEESNSLDSQDSISLTEGIQSETSNLTDSQDSISLTEGIQSETSNLTDSQDSVSLTGGIQSEASNLTDSQDSVSLTGGIQSETSNLTDNQVSTVDAGGILSEISNLEETSGAGTETQVTLAETNNLAEDSDAALITVQTSEILELADVTETNSSSFAGSSTSTEVAQLEELQAALIDVVAENLESSTGVETVLANLETTVQAIEITEAGSEQDTNLTVFVSTVEDISFQDQPLSSTILNVNLSEESTGVDLLSASYDINTSVEDFSDLIEISDTSGLNTTNQLEANILVDSVSNIATMVATIDENEVINSLEVGQLNSGSTLSETVALDDQTTGNLTSTSDINEILPTFDETDAVSGTIITITEDTIINSDESGISVQNATVEDQLNLVELAFGLAETVASINDGSNALDISEANISVVTTALDLAEIIDTISATSEITLNIEELSELIDESITSRGTFATLVEGIDLVELIDAAILLSGILNVDSRYIIRFKERDFNLLARARDYLVKSKYRNYRIKP